MNARRWSASGRRFAGLNAQAARVIELYGKARIFDVLPPPRYHAWCSAPGLWPRAARRCRLRIHAPLSKRRTGSRHQRTAQRLADDPLAAALSGHLQVARRVRARLPDRREGRQSGRADRDEEDRRRPRFGAAPDRARTCARFARHRADRRHRPARGGVCGGAAFHVALHRTARDPLCEGHRERGAHARAPGVPSSAFAVAALSPRAADGRHVARYRTRHARHPATRVVLAVQHPADARRSRPRARLLRRRSTRRTTRSSR